MINTDNEVYIKSKNKNNIITGKSICNHVDLVYEDTDYLITNEEDIKTLFNENEINHMQHVEQNINHINEYGNLFVIIKDKDKKEKIIKNYLEKKIHKHFNNIDNIFSKIKNEIPSKGLIDETKELFYKVSKKMNLQGKKINNIIIGIIYYAFRRQGNAKTFKEIGSMFDVSERLVKKEFNKIKNYIVEKTDEDDLKDIEKQYIDNFLGDKNNDYIKELAYNIVDNLNKANILEGKSTRTIAGLSLLFAYILCDDNLYDKEQFYNYFSNMNTLKKAFEEIKDSLDIIIPNEYIDKINIFQKEDKIFY